LVYKADEGGFQPEAKHIPVNVVDTDEVVAAKTQFYALFEEAKAKLAEVEAEAEAEVADENGIVEARRKRSVDVFRYVDEETGQSHYMTGEPGKAVEGGWTFTNSDGSYELVYKADEGGFQPEAKHIPVNVVDTDEVVAAKTQFYALFEEAKAKLAEVESAEEIVDARRKRDAVFRPQFHFHNDHEKPNPDAKYTYHPYYGFVPVDAKEGDAMEDMKEKQYQFIPYKGFVAVEDGEADAEVEKPLFKFVPFHGFVPVTPDEDKEKTFNFHPYYGYVPAKTETPDAPVFKFDPLHGFVPEAGEVENVEEKEFKFVPYQGFVPVDDETEAEDEAGGVKLHPYFKKLKDMRYKFVPYHGFVPKLDKVEAEARKKREAQGPQVGPLGPFLGHPPPPGALHHDISYNFHPYLGIVPTDPKKVEAAEDAAEPAVYKYVPHFGFVPTTEEDGEDTVTYKYDPLFGFIQDKEPEELKPIEEQEYKYEPLVGFVPLTGDEGDEKILKYKFDPFYGFVEAKKEGEEETKGGDDLFKFVPYYGFVPVNNDDNAEQTSLHHLQYTFHPYHGYMPTLIETEDKKEETLYKFDHLLGFVPAEKETEAAEDVAEVEE